MAAFRRLPNIREQLVKSGRETKTLENNKKCVDGRWKCCHLFSEAKDLEINGCSFTPVDCGTCRSSNVIYNIHCKKCKLHYIGETGQALSLRISGHRTTINQVVKGGKLDDEWNDNGTGYHFGDGQHNFEKDAEVTILEAGNWRTANQRCNKEDYYILKFDTLSPSGINIKKGMFTQTFKGMF
jgi:hypothetical protein